jgi:hypothetical protein
MNTNVHRRGFAESIASIALRGMALWLSGGLATGAASACLLSSLPYEHVQPALQLLADGRPSSSLTASQFSALVPRLRGIAAALLLAVAFVWIGRRHLDSYGAAVLNGVPALIRHARSWLASMVAVPLGERIGLAAVLAIGIGVRVAVLDGPMLYDEAQTYNSFASRSLPVLLSSYTVPNNHILHSLLVHFSTQVLGNTEAAVRLPALLAGVAIIPLTYALATSMHGPQAGVLAAGLATASPSLIAFSTNARGYTLLITLFLCCLLLALHLRRSHNPAAAALLGVLMSLGMFTVPTWCTGRPPFSPGWGMPASGTAVTRGARGR